MITTLITSFAVFSLSSGSRLLLQGAPLYVPVPQQLPEIPVAPLVPSLVPPIDPPVAPVDPVVVDPAVVDPAVVDPVVPVPAVLYPPVTPGSKATTLYPQLYPPVPPSSNQAATTKSECKVSPPSLLSCAGKPMTITNPGPNWELACTGYEGCAGATININFLSTASPALESIKGFWFTEEFAGAGAVININNHRPGDKIQIDEVKCDKKYSCYHTQFVIGANVELQIGDFFCAPDACDGCTVRESALTPAIPCYEFVEPI